MEVEMDRKIFSLCAYMLFSIPTAGYAANGGGWMELPTKVGTIAVRDFSQDPEVGQYPGVGSFWYIGYHHPDPSSGTQDPTASKNPPYEINYTPESGYFAIALLREPLGDTRKKAEQYLMSRLRVSKEVMCDLNYTLSVPNWVSARYAGEDLGFSFCPGAKKLGDQSKHKNKK
jgi:hypothetical protein